MDDDRSTRRVRFGGVAFLAVSSSPEVLAALAALDHLEPGAIAASTPGPTLRVEPESGGWRLTVTERGVAALDRPTEPSPSPELRFGAPVPSGGRFGSITAAVHGALSVMTERVVRAEPEWVHLHAGAVAIGPFGVLIPAASGTGKTTLTSELGALGAVLTDELVAVDRSAGLLRAPPRPLSVKASGFVRFASRHPEAGGGPEPAEGLWHVPLAFLGLRHQASAPAAVVLLPERRPGPASLDPVDAGEVLLRLIEHAYDLDVDPPRAFADLAWVATKSHPLRVSYEDAADARAVVERWLSSVVAPVGAPVVRVDDDRSGTLAAEVGGGAVLWQPRTRAVAWVDAAGAAAWRARTGNGARFVAGLAAAGFDLAPR